MSRVRVLVFPCGSEAALEIQQALGFSLHVELHGASSVDDHGRASFPSYHYLPNIADSTFESEFRALVQRLGIEVVFATHDTVHTHLASMLWRTGVYLVNGDPETASIVRRKSATYEIFKEQSWAPATFSSVDSVNDWPVVIKPDEGQGGQGVTIAYTPRQALAAFDSTPRPIICEFLPGDELTVDCFTDRRGRLLFIGPRTRERVRAGIANRSKAVPRSSEITEIAEAINGRFNFRGFWFFQTKRDRSGHWKLLEVCARLSSSSVMQRARGVNLPLMAIQDFLARDLIVLEESRVAVVERRLSTSAKLDYEFDTAYLDLDDTLIIDGNANPSAMCFIYRLLALKKKVILITRHQQDIGVTLARVRISPELFDQIIHITDGCPKSDFIEGRAIFVDNHFPERLDVAARRGIPVFDVDALDLINVC